LFTRSNTPNKLTTPKKYMTRKTFLLIAISSCAWVTASSLNAATVPAGTTLTVRTVSLISSKDAVGRSFEAKIDQDVSVNGKVLLKGGTKTFGRIKASRANPRKSAPLSLELASISVNGRKVPVKTSSVQPESDPKTARQLRTGITVGTSVLQPGSRLEFQLAQPVSL
jgi:hypothetical protein